MRGLFLRWLRLMKTLETLPRALLHAVLTGDRQRLYDVDALFDELVFHLLVAVEAEVAGQQAADEQGGEQGEGQHPGTQAVFGHSRLLVGQCRAVKPAHHDIATLRHQVLWPSFSSPSPKPVPRGA